MSNRMTLEQVEQVAVQLPPPEQLELLKRLSEQLTETTSPPVTVSRKRRTREVAAFLRECDRAATAFTRKTDSAEAIRRMRDERCRQICQSES